MKQENMAVEARSCSTACWSGRLTGISLVQVTMRSQKRPHEADSRYQYVVFHDDAMKLTRDSSRTLDFPRAFAFEARLMVASTSPLKSPGRCGYRSYLRY
jgi:hypothetical protein